MKKLIIFIPILFWSLQPYNQNTNEVNHKTDSMHFSIETDTMILKYSIDMLKVESKELQQLESYRDRLKREIRQIQQKKQREERMLREIKKDLDNYENRGL